MKANEKQEGASITLTATQMRKNDMGQFYQYVSLKAGQTFSGVWQGATEDINSLLECLKKRSNKLRLGRSRTAEYGGVTFSLGENPLPDNNIVEQTRTATRFTLVLTTPMVLFDAEGRNALDPQFIVDELNAEIDCGAKLKESFLRMTERSGYNAKWRLPKPQLPALGAGSALVIETEKAISPKQLEGKRWGAQTGEGFGEVKVHVHEGWTAGQENVACKMTLMPIDKNDSSKDVVLTLEENQHAALSWLVDQKRQKETKENLFREGGQAAENKYKELNVSANSSKIHQIIALFDKYLDYNLLKIELDKMEDKKYSELIEPCVGKEPDYIRGYLQTVKWEARNGK
ncbi:MAG: hypothetical protein K6T85_05875 [Gorillibacterium sp.]|nr:hypothetical protein [Gorillibacterium sp.]